MRSLWSGHLGFGLVNIPVKLFKATESHDIGFNQHHGGGCGGRIGMPRVCKECGEVVEYADIVKGITVDGTVVIVDQDDLDQLADEQGKQIEILRFVDALEIDPLMYENTYYIGAPEGERPYALLREAMAESGLVAIGRFMLRSKTQLCALRVVDNVVLLHTLLWPDEVRPNDEVPGLDGSVKAAELKAARMLVESMVGAFDPDDYRDEYQERLKELIDARAGDQEFVAHVPEKVAEEEVSDLLAQLEASIARHPAGKKRPAAKKAPAKKAPAKKAARRGRRVA